MSRPKTYDPEPGYQFQLFCRCDSVSWEHCDYAKDPDDLDYLITEYSMAYGAGWEFKWEQLPKKYWPEPTKHLVEVKDDHDRN